MEYFHQYHTGPQVIHNKRISYAPHLHDELEIITLFDGSAVLTVDGADYNIKKSDFVIVFPNVVHSYRNESNADAGKFIFSICGYSELNELFKDKIPEIPVISAEKAEKKHIDRLAAEIIECYHSSSAIVQKTYLALLAAKLLELCKFKENSSGDIIHRVMEYCKNNYREDITLNDVANALFVSKSYVSHIFCGKLKINFRSYINMLRINAAAELLHDKSISVTEAAEQSGFGSLRSFNRAFLRYIGVTPKEYRNSCG